MTRKEATIAAFCDLEKCLTAHSMTSRDDDRLVARGARTVALSNNHGVRRLRDELDASLVAYQSQLRGYAATLKNPTTDNPTPTLQPRWQELDATLASMKFESCERYGLNAKTRGGGSASVPRRRTKVTIPEQVVESARRTRRSPDATPNDRATIAFKYLLIWRDLTRATAVTRALTRRAVSHHCSTVVQRAFHCWQLHWRYQQYLMCSAQVVATRAQRRVSDHMYRRWAYAFRVRMTVRAIQDSQQRSLLSTTLAAWRLNARSCRQFRTIQQRVRKHALDGAWNQWQTIRRRRLRVRRLNAAAQRRFLRSQWDKLVTNMRRGNERQRVAEWMLARQKLRIVASSFESWANYCEQQKRRAFAAQWHRQHALASVFDCWSTEHARSRRIAMWETRLRRKILRHRLRQGIQQWLSSTLYFRRRLELVTRIVHKTLLRAGLKSLCGFANMMNKSEHNFSQWKRRRALHLWLSRSHQRRSLKNRAGMVANRHERFVKANSGWIPWRVAHRRSVNFRALSCRRRSRELRLAWEAFCNAVMNRRELRLTITMTKCTIQERKLGHAISTWRQYATVSTTRRSIIEESLLKYNLKLMQWSLVTWSSWVAHKRKKIEMYAVANGYLIARTVLQWRRRTIDLLHQRTTKLAAAEGRRRVAMMSNAFQQLIENTKYQNDRRIRLAFAVWLRETRLNIARRALAAVALSVQLAVHFKRWTNWTEHAIKLQQKSQAVTASMEKRLLFRCFIGTWRLKWKQYRRAERRLCTLSRRMSLTEAFTRWKQWRWCQADRLKAGVFYQRLIERRCLRSLYCVTVGISSQAKKHHRQRQLCRIWIRWHQEHRRAIVQIEAIAQLRRTKLVKAISALQTHAIKSLTLKVDQQRAEAWHGAVVLQTTFDRWRHFTLQCIRLRLAGHQLCWRSVGSTHFSKWWDALIMRRKYRSADLLHGRVILRRCWNSFLQLTKRRLVARAMWRYTMARIRQARAFGAWKWYAQKRRCLQSSVINLRWIWNRRRLHGSFSSWRLVLAAEAFRIQCEGRNRYHWMRRCFALLRRFTLTRQAYHDVSRRNSRLLLRKILLSWRIEYHLHSGQRVVERKLLQKCIRSWCVYSAACKRQRNWVRYVQHLHEIQRGRPGGASQHEEYSSSTRRLKHKLSSGQEMLKRVVHAWYLVTKCSSRRRSQQHYIECLHSRRATVKTERPGYARPARKHNRRADDRLLALRFWSEHLVALVFHSWRSYTTTRSRIGGMARKEQSVFVRQA